MNFNGIDIEKENDNNGIKTNEGEFLLLFQTNI